MPSSSARPRPAGESDAPSSSSANHDGPHLTTSSSSPPRPTVRSRTASNASAVSASSVISTSSQHRLDEQQAQEDPQVQTDSLSASFLSNFGVARTPTARYSFDDHQDYFHRLEWEALVQHERDVQAHQLQPPATTADPATNQPAGTAFIADGHGATPADTLSQPRTSSGSTCAGETQKPKLDSDDHYKDSQDDMFPQRSKTEPSAAASQSSLSRRSLGAVVAAADDTAVPASAAALAGRPSLLTQLSAHRHHPHRHHRAQRERSNSTDGTSPRGSFRDGRYTTRPRHAHPGPPALHMHSQHPGLLGPQSGKHGINRVPGAANGPRPGSASSARPRSNSRSEDPISWGQRSGLVLFNDASAPGINFPHPSVLGSGAGQRGTSTDGGHADDAEFENLVQPWDSPRPLKRSISLAPSHEGVQRPKVGIEDALPQPGTAVHPSAVGQLAGADAVVRRDHALPDQGGLGGPDSTSGREQTSAKDVAADSEAADDGNDAQSHTSQPQKLPLSTRISHSISRVRMSSNYFALYKFCDRTDVLLLIVGIIAAIGSGVPLPLIGILFGQLIDGFNSASCGGGGQPGDTTAFLASVNDKVSKIAIVAAVNFVLIWTYTTCWSNLGERLVRKMRQRYLTSVLRQDMSFFDTLKPGEVGTRLSADLLTIQNGTSEKMGIMISSLSYFVTSYIVAFIKLPVLAAQLVSLLPAFGIVSLIGSKAVAKAQKNTSTHLSNAASLAAEALNNLPVVQAFGSQARLSNIYSSHLELARRQGTRKALAAAAVLGMLFFVGYSANALAFFSGSRLIAGSGDSGTVGSVYTVIFLLLDASFIIGQIAPYLQTFSAASGAGQALLETINKPSPIDGTDEVNGLIPQPGDFPAISVQFHDVEFSYPSRPDEMALQGLSINVPAGQRIALVGMSGSGKSTVAALTQRFYDPARGRVTVNDIDLRDFNVRWWRSQVGVVGQEPVLFDCTIMQSIAHGLLGSPAHAHLQDTLLAFSQVGQEAEGTEIEQVLTEAQLKQMDQVRALCIRAAEMANADSFIRALPGGYDAQVGEAGGKLSGGQKQRISIARAIVKQPKLLILDEATAALDSHSENTVTQALDSISEGVTTIAIAHRLATVRNYDNIVVMGAGKVLEQGTHKQLLALRGVYYKLAKAQDTAPEDKTVDAEEGVEDSKADAPAHRSTSSARSADEAKTMPTKSARMDDVDEADEGADDNDAEESSRDSTQSTLASDTAAGEAKDRASDAEPGAASLQSTPKESPPTTSGDGEKAALPAASASSPGRDSADCLECQKDQDGESDDKDTPASRYPARVILKRILWLVRREWYFILAGLLTSTIMGGSYSGEAVLFGHVIDALNPQCQSPADVRAAGREFGLYFFILALIQLVAYSLNGLMWGLVAERLLFRLRRVSFNTMLSQRLVWYENEGKTPASMISSLSNDANNLGGVTGVVIGTIFCIFVNLAAGIIVSHAIAWRIAIVILALVPIILTAGYLRLKVLADFQKRHETAYVKSNSLAIEAVQCIKTVAGLGRERDVLLKFQRSLRKPYREAKRHFMFGNVFLALALSISYFIYAFAYWWGSKNIAEGRYSQTAFFIVLPALLFSAQASGQLLAFAPDFSKAHVSAANFFRLLDQRPSEIERRRRVNSHQQQQDEEPKPPKAHRNGLLSSLASTPKSKSETGEKQRDADIEASSSLRAADDVEKQGPSSVVFSNVSFTYPSRSDPALKSISLTIPPGSFAAFVGQSGSGKTTAMSLIENFYTPSEGFVAVDGKRTDKTPDQVLRRDIAIVPQEPVIFYGTVRFNVLLGLRPDVCASSTAGDRNGERDAEEEEEEEEEDLMAPYQEDLGWQHAVSDAEIEDVCRQAGIHDTIMGFKRGYDTLISSSQLSGGQKQRLSIARALIRKPRLLLLDESTSALDSHAEQAFQTTLSNIRSQRSCTILAIAHRMRTIRDADVIFLFDNGSLVASGPHHDLLRKCPSFRAMSLPGSRDCVLQQLALGSTSNRGLWKQDVGSRSRHLRPQACYDGRGRGTFVEIMPSQNSGDSGSGGFGSGA
ncbi:hypothetical protein BCV70DRAFT_221806 [Testicularia cyperi]|uniref:P-loop containing nucleoside triphosphate hydrolase protein n=1 Tax=Testicularia cyperi TaxID=1882483 RepID=A0A317XUS6_9BASI|nr:hypothetical protein BCV70DRAFT_221806 [Testicularia cyperi]